MSDYGALVLESAAGVSTFNVNEGHVATRQLAAATGPPPWLRSCATSRIPRPIAFESRRDSKQELSREAGPATLACQCEWDIGMFVSTNDAPMRQHAAE